MHPRNPYRNPPDFADLASSYPLLLPHLNSQGRTIDFKDDAAQRRLTEAIMLRDFGVNLQIPEDRLCPPVPNRMNYVLWIQDIIYAHRDMLETRPRRIHGIDIGTGATAIYPILACKMKETWDMVGTEIDDASFECARRNVESNGLRDRIDVRKASPQGNILFPLEDADSKYAFCMCNPPFYSSSTEVEDLAREKVLPPTAVCTGADVEMIYPDGGEAGFVGRMVQESESFQTRCKWYTSMFGKMSSVATVVEMLRERSITNYAITEFVQGQTRRWAVAWSYTDVHLPDSVARIPNLPSGHALAPLMPPKNTLSQPLSIQTSTTHEAACALVSDVLALVDGVRSVERPAPGQKGLFFVEANANTWSRSARRKKARLKHETSESGGQETTASLPKANEGLSSGSAEPALTCSVRLVASDPPPSSVSVPSSTSPSSSLSSTAATTAKPATSSAEGSAVAWSLEFQWIFGRDRALFESFASHLGRKVGAQTDSRV